MILESDLKYIKENFSLWIYVYAGENLSSTAKLKLVSHSLQLERYILRGGISSISKLYHDYKEIVDLTREVKFEGDKQTKEEDYYAPLVTLV